MEALFLRIRSDFRTYRQKFMAIRKMEWRNILILNLAVPFLLIVAYPLIKNLPFKNLFLIYVFSPLLLLFGLNDFFQNLPQKLTLKIAFLLVTIALATFVWLINPDLNPKIFPNSGWFSLIALVITWVVLSWLFEKNIPQTRRYSLIPAYPYIHIATGAFVGAGLALHALLVARFFPIPDLPLPGLYTEKVIWLFGLFAGLLIPSEELFYRGKIFTLLFDEKLFSLRKTILWVDTLNIILYVPAWIYLASNPNALLYGTIVLIYKLILSTISTYIIYRWRNIYVGFAANVAFSMIIIQPFYL